jgi:carbamoyl-phosphate synthase large subunit
MKLLITGAEGDIADSLCRIARSCWADAVVHGSDRSGDSWPCANGFAVIHQLPDAAAPEYLDALIDLHLREQFDAVIPATDAELWALSGGWPDDLPLLALDVHWLRLALDKAATPRWLAASNLPAPRTTDLSAATADDLPLMVKPRRGHGSQDLELVHTPARLAVIQAERSDDAIAQEYLPDETSEFTCCIFRDRRSGAVRTVTFRRLLQGGLTGRATVEHVESIQHLLHAIAMAGDLDGSVNVQLRLTEKGPMVFEINPRFSSTVMMRHSIGFRDFVWTIESRLRGTPPSEWSPPLGTRIFRLARELLVTATDPARP